MTHPARAMAREQARQARKNGLQAVQAPPPSAGAVDLGAIKGGDPAKQREAAEDKMRQNGFLCSCGQRFEDEAIQVMGFNLGRFPEQKMVMTPQGPQMQTTVEDSCQFLGQNFCSRSCPDFADAVKNGIDPGEEARNNGVIRPKIRAIRTLPAVEWIDEETED